ncbi:tight junction protein ZO-1 isoform X2 [Cylas formicarius]|uniref:tight junction protein ZO-1 isoform X2 n=1 Tax=Cylas formicarius TaxID=197179 RepID=UPI0029583AC1|nr:tight junction protein ZO-1 isoform X2 [Cylas formicarius]
METIAINNLGHNLPEERGWDYKQICVTRVPGYGFGIAVSGGRDNPHFASGDPSIAVSDVLASGPAERLLQVNDRIISVNGISLQNVDYATAVQVLRDSGDTVTLVIKRRALQHIHGHSASYSGPSTLAALGIATPPPAKVTLVKGSKKEDFGIVLGCKLFIKEISSKTREQLINSNQLLEVGDFITKLNNTSCNDVMSLKEAKKIIDGCKDKLHITVARDYAGASNASHQAQSSISTTGAVNNFYKGDDFLTSSNQSYSNQNLYVQPPTRNTNLNQNGSFDEKADPLSNNGPNSLPEDKSNLAPRGGRSRGPLSEANLSQIEQRNSSAAYGRTKGDREEPPRPPPPRAEDYYSSRRQMYEEDPIIQKTKQPIPDARFITFHKEGSVGIRLTGGNFSGIFVTAVQPGSPASLQGLQPGDKILKVNDMDMAGVTREEAVLFLLSLQDRIELIVQYCKEEYDNIVASQKGDSFYIKTHFHYENPAKGEMSFRSGDVFHVIDTLYNGVVGCWQVFRIGRNNQEVQKGIIPNKSRAEELATAQFNATKKEMSANESRGSFFKRRRSSNRRSKSLGKEHWDDILFSDTISKFPAYEKVLLKHPGFTRPVILFGAISDIARDKLLKDFPDKFISPQLDVSAEESVKSPKSTSNIIRLSAIRDVIATGKHALLDITPNAVERLNYAQMYPIVVFFKAETKMVVKQLRVGLPKSAHKSSKKLLEQCQKLDKVWSHIFNATITLTDNTDSWYRKVREIIDKQQSGALWMSESKSSDFYSQLSYPSIFLTPKSTNSLPGHYRPSRSRTKRAPLSMYSSPQFIHRTSPLYMSRDRSPSVCRECTSVYAPQNSWAVTSIYADESSPAMSRECSVYVPERSCSPEARDRDTLTYETCQNYPEESLSDDFLFPMSSLRLSYASSPESDLEHSPGPPASPTGTVGGVAGRLTKASSDPSVVLPPESGASDVLPPYQPNYDPRYGFGNQNQQQPILDGQTPLVESTLTKDPSYTLSNTDIPSSLGPPPEYNKEGLYSASIYQKSSDFGKPNNNFGNQERRDDYGSPDRREYNDRAMQHKRQASTLLGPYNQSKLHEQSPSKEGIYGGAPDLPPRVDRAAKPMGLVTTPGKIPNGRSAHERLFGTKPSQVDSAEVANGNENGGFGINNKAGSLDRSQNSKSDSLSSYDSYNKQSSTRIGPNAHDDLKTTLSKIETTTSRNTHQGSPSRNPRWNDQQNHHRHGGSKLDLKYGMPLGDPNMDGSPRNSRDLLDKDATIPSEPVSPRGSVERDMYRYSRSPAKQNIPSKSHMETKTDYGKYRNNNNTNGNNMGLPPPHQPPPEYTRSSHQDLRESQLSIHQHSPLRNQPMNHNGYDIGSPGNPPSMNGNQYKPIPPPKPKNYKPPYKQGYGGPADGMIQPPPIYQHGKSHSNPVDPRHQNPNNPHNYYYNSPPPSMLQGGNHHAAPYYPDGGRGVVGHYEMAPSYHHESPRRHPSISYASRSEIAPIAHHDYNTNEHHAMGGDPLMENHRPPAVVDLQGSREQRGSAFELYRKPVGHNLRSFMDSQPAFYGSQPNIAQKLNQSATNSPKPKPKLTKAQSFKHTKSENGGFSTPKLFRKLSFGRKSREGTPKMSKKLSLQPETIKEYQVMKDFNRNAQDFTRPSKRDITSAYMDHRGGTLVNEYWGVSLEVPEGAIPPGEEKHIYFVISDPRLCESAPPLDLDNGETMLSPLVMCGPQGTEFLKPVILNIPHYANTLPSLGITLKATDSEKDIHTDWDNILLPSNHAANSVAVKVDHF